MIDSFYYKKDYFWKNRSFYTVNLEYREFFHKCNLL